MLPQNAGLCCVSFKFIHWTANGWPATIGPAFDSKSFKAGKQTVGPKLEGSCGNFGVDDIQWFTYIGSYVEVIWNDIHVYIYILYLFKIKQYNTPEYLCVDHLSWTVAASWQGNANIDWQHVWTYLRPWCMMLHMIDFPCGSLRPQIH